MSDRIPEGHDKRQAFSPLSLRVATNKENRSKSASNKNAKLTALPVAITSLNTGIITNENAAVSATLSSITSDHTNDLKSGSNSNHQARKQNSYSDRYIALNVKNIYAVQEEITDPSSYGRVDGQNDNSEDQQINDCDHEEKCELIKSYLTDSDMPLDGRVMRFSQKAPESAEAGVGSSIQFSSAPVTRPRWKSRRHIPKAPERILDAPDLKDDYYLNLLHWGNENSIAIGLSSTVYVWRANSGDIVRLTNVESSTEEGYDVCSVRWSQNNIDGCLAVGLDNGLIQIWDVNREACLRSLPGHAGRVPSLSWNASILSSGSRSGLIINYDVRLANPTISRIVGVHTQEICGMSWSYDGHYLATGSNDNTANIWTYAAAMAGDMSPLHHMTSHQAAVKALAWNPNEPNVIATGGGMNDRRIYFWNVYNGSVLGQINATSQVSGLIWNPFESEILSSHGYSQNQLSIWSYPGLHLHANLTGHTQRILSTSISPNGTTVASLAADETIRLWRCFEPGRSRENAADRGRNRADEVDNEKIRAATRTNLNNLR